MAAMKEATGIDLKDLIEANGKEAKITRNVNITGLEAKNSEPEVEGGAIEEEVVSAVVSQEITDASSDN